jgi:hypothetical protein
MIIKREAYKSVVDKVGGGEVTKRLPNRNFFLEKYLTITITRQMMKWTRALKISISDVGLYQVSGYR